MTDDATVPEEMSILEGVDGLIDSALGLGGTGVPPRHRNRGPCSLRKPMKGAQVCAHIESILDRIGKNWDASSHSKSEQNWRFKKNTRISERNRSKEVRCERAIVSIPEEVWPDAKNWANQVPVASGLAGSERDKKRCIDLVHKCGDRAYEFIELKIASDTPLYAAMEILKYGILYVFCREDTRAKKHMHIHANENMLEADRIHLRVLAPLAFYQEDAGSCDLSWLARSLNAGLAIFLDQHEYPFEIDFRFETLWRIPLRSPFTWRKPE